MIDHRTRLTEVILCGLALLVHVGARPAQARYGDLSAELVNQTNDRYGHNCFWQGPRGLPYGELPKARGPTGRRTSWGFHRGR